MTSVLPFKIIPALIRASFASLPPQEKYIMQLFFILPGAIRRSGRAKVALGSFTKSVSV